MQEQKPICCPDESEPAVSTTYQPQGKIVNINGLNVYEIGQSDKVVLVFTDIYGLGEGSRIKQVCDQIASNGFTLLVIDFFGTDAWPKDEPIDFQKLIQNIKKLNKDVILTGTQNVREYAIQNGGKQFALIGACWGDWAAWQASTQDGYQCAIGWHPSVQLEQMVFNSSQQLLAQNIKCPQLQLTAGNDQINQKEGGELINILKQKNFGQYVRTFDFPNMIHGWVVRGDLSKPETVSEIQRALKLTIDYLKELMV